MAAKKTFILHIKGPESSQDFTIPQGTTLIGREAGVGLQLPYPLVSRKHAQLVCSDDTCEITDLGSANGTLVNGNPLAPNAPTLLSHGDALSIGPFEITCEVVAVEAIEPSATVPEVEAPPPAAKRGAAPPVEAPPPAKPAKKGATPPEEAKPAEASPKPAAAKPTRAAKGKPAGKAAAPAEPPQAEQPPPAAPPPPPVAAAPAVPVPGDGSVLAIGQLPPGLGLRSQRLIQNLPGIYQTDFMSRFLALFEATLLPLEWTIDHFHLYLSPGTAPNDFLPWLANWFEIVFDSTWSEAQRRTLLSEAGILYARRGTRWALTRVLEIYLGKAPEIVEFQDAKDPYTFAIKLPIRLGQVSRPLIELIVDASKPAHTNYNLEFAT